MKKTAIIAGLAVGVCLIGGGVWFGVSKMNQKEIKVVPVSQLEQRFGGDETNLGGMISSDVSQDVHLTDKQLVQEVFVKEGDQVEVGTPLLSYDMTLVSIELEMAKLDQESLKIQKQAAEKELEKLQKETPVVKENQNKPETKKTDIEKKTQSQNIQGQNISGQNIPGQNIPGQNMSMNLTKDNKEENAEKLEVVLYGDLNQPLDKDSKAYKGLGTKEDPFLFLCKENPNIKGSFLNLLGGFQDGNDKTQVETFAQLEIRTDNKADGLLLAALRIDGRKIVEKCEPDEIYSTRLSDKPVVEPPVLDPGANPKEEEPGDSQENGTLEDGDLEGGSLGEMQGDFPFGDVLTEDEIIKGYTKKELEEAIRGKKQDLKKLDLDTREASLKIAKIEDKLGKETITSTIKGTVKGVGNPEKGEIDGKPFMQVVSSEGLYVQGTISELMLDSIRVGQKLKGSSHESGTIFDAEIKEISPYPVNSNAFGSAGNENSSYYPFMAYIPDGNGLRNQEYVGLSMNLAEVGAMGALYIQKAFVREENGTSYIYRATEKNKLEKHEILTGKTIYGTAIEIKDGLTAEDRIAFPYGKGVRNGAPTVDATVEELYQ